MSENQIENKIRDTLTQLKEYLPKQVKNLPFDPTEAKKKIDILTRQIDPGLLEEIKRKIGYDILEFLGIEKAKISFVVDSNIIIQDSFRVASGKESTTYRIFSSPFLRLVAPSSIGSEVYTKILKP